MNNNNMEIERKFLIKYPSAEFLAEFTDCTEIEQTYLTVSEHGGRMRVRKRGKEGNWVYTKTEKKHITDISRVEIESEITEQEYLNFLNFRDPERATVRKTRYCYNYKEQLFEIDVYPFWSDKAVMEIELESEQQQVFFPEDITIIEEVTANKEYTNVSIAKKLQNNEL